MPTRTGRLTSLLLKLALTALVLAGAGIVWLDAWIVDTFNGRKWELPATVYARPLELYAGRAISRDAVVRELRAAGYQQDASGKPGTYYQPEDRLVVFTRPFAFRDGEQGTRRLNLRFDQRRIVDFATDNQDDYSLRLEPIAIGKIYSPKREERLLVTLEETPAALVNALLATEDRHFFEHHGIALKSIARAMIANLREGRIVEGGSTLTQQLVKNLFLNDQRSYSRKLLEAVMAVILELRVDKHTILEAYINEVYVAQDGRRAIHGFGLASRYLFNRDLASLSLADCALLVGMMKGPSYYNPLKHPDRATRRRNLVIDLMAQQGMITSEQAQTARRAGLNLARNRHDNATYPAYLDLVRRQLRRDYSDKQLASEGLRIFTNMDPQWQWHSQAMLAQHTKRLADSYPAAEGLQGAAVVIDHATGDVLAIVGDSNPRVAGFNRALDAARPIGSLVKPAVYLTALENGYTLGSLVDDSPITVMIDQQQWQPQNFDRQYHGRIPAFQALANSYNVATVNLGLTVGLDKVRDTLQRLGVEKSVPHLPSVLLGAVDLSPLEVAQMYSTIAAKGFYTPLKSIRGITDHQGRALKRYPLKLESRLSIQHQHLLDFALQNVMHQGTGRSVRHRFPQNSLVAGKTGTSSDQRDSWFAGYNNRQLAVVWLGQDDNRPLPVTGGTGALPVWADIMQQSRAKPGRRVIPDDVHYLWVDADSGKLSGERCDNAVYLPYINGTEPQDLAQCTISDNPIKHWFKKWFSVFD